MYSLKVSLIILGMICTGAARSVGVKLLYQLGFDNYLFVALLYLLGQSLALLVYWCPTATWSRCSFLLDDGGGDDDDDNQEDNDANHDYARIQIQGDSYYSDLDEEGRDIGAVNVNVNNDGVKSTSTQINILSSSMAMAMAKDAGEGLSELELQPIQSMKKMVAYSDDKDQQEQAQQHQHQQEPLHHSLSAPIVYAVHPEGNLYSNQSDNTPQLTPEVAMLQHAQSMSLPSSRRQQLRRQGSNTGLTQESQRAVAWIHTIPWQLKPLIPGLFNLANAALKWASFVYVAASIAEMLMAGLELVLSVLVARGVRKRQISNLRWAGVGIVAVGLWVVHSADVLDTQHQASQLDSPEQAAQLKRDHVMGAFLIVGQCVTAVGQDMAEELFLQEAAFPATLLLGMEGVYGLLFGIPLYLQFAPESMLTTIQGLEASSWEILYIALLTMVFTITGIFNIMTTGVTSSMTRNMWKNCRTILVWVMGLVLYYSLGNQDFGEEWKMPDSFFILGGFMIMLSGIYVYYKHK